MGWEFLRTRYLDIFKHEIAENCNNVQQVTSVLNFVRVFQVEKKKINETKICKV